MPEQDDLDSLLDSALANYAAPLPDLEARLQHVIAAQGRGSAARRQRWLPWAVSIPAVACMLIALIVFLHPRQARLNPVQQAHNPTAVHDSAQAAIPMAHPVTAGGRHRRTSGESRNSLSHTSSVIAKLPKREVFPTPQPLSPAEQAFVKYVAMAPEKERRALLPPQTQQDAPLEISAIKISPITIPDPSGNQGEP